MPLLEIKNVTKSFKDQVVLNDVSLVFPRTGLVIIKGESGSGKSTLLKCILGIIKIDRGSILYKGKKIKSFNHFRNLHTGYVFQNYSLISFLNPKENIELGLKKENLDVNEISKRVNIYEKLGQNVKTLSGGEKQRIALGRALSGNPEILLCDEPTGSLDKENALSIMQLLKEISKERLVIVVTHNEEHVSLFSDVVMEVKNGKVFVNKEVESTRLNPIKENLHYLSLKRVLKICFSLVKDNFRKISFSLVSLTLALGFLLLSLSSYLSIKGMIEENKTKFMNYNFLKIALNEKTKMENSSFSLVRVVLPSKDDMAYISDSLVGTKLHFDLTPVVPSYPNVFLNANKKSFIDKIEFCPYFLSSKDNMDDLVEGEFSSSFNEVIINKKAKEILMQDYFYLDLSSTIDYMTSDDFIVTDSYHQEVKMDVVGCVNEFSLVDIPRVYYPYDYLEDLTKQIRLDNLSSFFRKEVSLYERMTKYTYKKDTFCSKYYVIEVPEISKVKKVYSSIKGISFHDNYFDVENDSILIVSSFNDVFNSIYEVITIFIGLTIVISILLLGLSLDSLVNDYKIDIGIMMCSGILKFDIKCIFIFISIILGIISALLSFLVFRFGGLLLNNFLLKDLSMINIPSRIPLNVTLILFSSTIAISFISSCASLLRIDKLQIGEILREE